MAGLIMHINEFKYLSRWVDVPLPCNVLVIEVTHYVKDHYVIAISS